MRKLFLSVAILAVAASCSKNEEFSIPNGEGIGFATLNSRVTKVANVNDDATSDSYQVYANTTATGETSWFIDETVSDANAIESGNIYYWPAGGATVNFYAFAPAIETSGPLAYNTAATYKTSIPLKFTVPADADVDFTVATPVLEAEYGSATQGAVSADGKVTLPFAHMLSKASMTIKLDTELTKTSTFTFGTATFTVKNNAVTTDAVMAAGETPTSTPVAGAATYSYLFTTDDNTVAKTEFEADNELFFAPQEAAAGCVVTLTDVVIKTGTTPIYDGDLTYKIGDTQVFAQGKAYAFTITISAAAAELPIISFDAVDTGWVTGDAVGLTESEE